LLQLASNLRLSARKLNDSTSPRARQSTTSAPQSTVFDDDWLLVQLPTRLPALREASITPDAAVSSNVAWPAAGFGDDPTAAVAVSLPSARTDRFDDALRRSAPGRLGRLVVYKSGRAKLVLEGPDGTPAVRAFLATRSFERPAMLSFGSPFRVLSWRRFEWM
jgi:hypothetical protein